MDPASIHLPEIGTVEVVDLGSISYAEALEIQRARQREVIGSRGAGRRTMWLYLLEHVPPVITVSRRPAARDHLVASDKQLLAKGVEVAETDRGGDITWHGPGQLVVYPILDLNAFGLRLHGYIRLLESTIIDVLHRFGLTGQRDAGATGVWIEDGSAGRASKIAAIGVRVSRWVSMHGLALNVDVDLSFFDLIVPCGLHGRTVTSMSRHVKGEPVMMEQVKQAMRDAFERALAGTGSTGGQAVNP